LAEEVIQAVSFVHIVNAVGNLPTMSARTVPSGSMADVYSKAKGKVTFVNVLAGNLKKQVDASVDLSVRYPFCNAHLTSVSDPPPKLMIKRILLRNESKLQNSRRYLLVVVTGILCPRNEYSVSMRNLERSDPTYTAEISLNFAENQFGFVALYERNGERLR
jgi:hypothetical protein